MKSGVLSTMLGKYIGGSFFDHLSPKQLLLRLNVGMKDVLFKNICHWQPEGKIDPN